MPSTDPVSPTDVLDSSDPGDTTQRNFRYQHAYGVILLVAAAAGKKPYLNVWCEHHEDLLAERDDGLFDAYQIKTAKPENGAWTLTAEELKKSIKKFVELDLKFPGKIIEFHFVSNVACLDTSDKKKLYLSPLVLLRAAEVAQDESALPEGAKAAFDTLKGHCRCSSTDLLKVLKRLRLVEGPERNSFEAEISHNHLPQLEECRSWSPAELNGLRDELIQKVFYASSRETGDPSRHWRCVNGNDIDDPYLRAKRLPVVDVVKFIQEKQPVPFRFSPLASDAPVELGSLTETLPILEAKMIKADLLDQFPIMRRRALSAERHLIGLAHIRPESINEVLDQIAIAVEGECQEALLTASQQGEPFGRRMMDDVYKRLRKLAEERPQMVHHQQYECLVGVAGLLTGECTIWWSKPFPLDVQL